MLNMVIWTVLRKEAIVEEKGAAGPVYDIWCIMIMMMVMYNDDDDHSDDDDDDDDDDDV